MIKRFSKVTNGLYRGSAPSIEDVIDLHKNFKINKIISLDEKAGNNIKNINKLLNIKHIFYPINGFDIKSILNLFSLNLKKLLLDDGPTFIHCLHGKDRTGMIVAMFQCAYNNMSYDEALNEALKFGFGFGLDPKITNLYKNVIKSYSNSKNDINNLDIVNNARQHFDWKSSIIDSADRSSFAPFMDPSRTYPDSEVYDYKYLDNFSPPQTSTYNHIPFVGQRDNDAGSIGTGVVENGGGFVNV